MKVEVQPRTRTAKLGRPSLYQDLMMRLLAAEQQPHHAVVLTFETDDDAKIVGRLRNHLCSWRARSRYFGEDEEGTPHWVRLRSYYRSETQVELWLERRKRPRDLNAQAEETGGANTRA